MMTRDALAYSLGLAAMQGGNDNCGVYINRRRRRSHQQGDHQGGPNTDKNICWDER